MASEIGNGELSAASSGTFVYKRRHIVLILCDGMGNSILEGALPAADGGGGESSDRSESFFRGANDPSRLRAVFPSTTPAALTTLATATWPGRHGTHTKRQLLQFVASFFSFVAVPSLTVNLSTILHARTCQ